MVGKFGFLCVGAVVLGSTFAMPSSSELEKVKAEVDAIVKDVDAREKGDWCKAGDAILSLGGEATKDAECFLLRREAALRYLKSSNAERPRMRWLGLSTTGIQNQCWRSTSISADS